MDRAELTLVVAGALVAAVVLGWAIGAIGARLGAPSRAGRLRDLADRLDAAEAARRQAEARLIEVEADLVARLREAEAEREEAEAALARERALTEDVRAAYRAATEGQG